MRNREVIEREMYAAREDLEVTLAELKHVVQEKIDVKARARVAVAKGKIMAQDALEQGKERAQELYAQGKDKAQHVLERGKTASRDLADRGRDGAVDLYAKAKDRPEIVGTVVGGIVVAGAVFYVGRRKAWW